MKNDETMVTVVNPYNQFPQLVFISMSEDWAMMEAILEGIDRISVALLKKSVEAPNRIHRAEMLIKVEVPPLNTLSSSKSASMRPNPQCSMENAPQSGQPCKSA